MSLSASPRLEDEPSTAAEFPSRAINLLLIFFGTCYLAFLGHYPLVDPDEPVYAETGKLMALGHGLAAWWTPHFNGQMWFDKPPLTYWLVGLSMKLLGPSEFAARLPMALAAIGLVWVSARLSWRLYPGSKSSPVWAALIAGSCVQSLILAHACVTDMLLALCLTCALWGVWEWLSSERLGPILLAGVAVGLGALVKGPVAIVLIGMLVALATGLTGRIRRFFSAPVWVSLLVALIISAPWYASMVHLHGQYFVRSFLEAQNVTRYLSAEHASTASPLFFIPVLLVGFLPWTIALIPALATSWRRAIAGDAGDRFALVWILLVFVFFSASQSKLVTYIYPLYPMAAAVTGHWIGECLRDRSARWLAAFGAVIVAAAMGFGLSQAGFSSALAICLGILVVFPHILGALFPRAGARHSPWFAWMTPKRLLAEPGIMLTILVAVAAAGPMWGHPDPKSISAEAMGRLVARFSKPGDTIYALTFEKPSLVYYSNRNIIFTDNQEMVGPALSRPQLPLCVTKPDIIKSLERKRLLGSYKILAQTGAQVVLIRCGRESGR